MGDELARGDVEESDRAARAADAAHDEVVVLWQEAAEEDKELLRPPQEGVRLEVPEGDDAVFGAADQELVRLRYVEVEDGIRVALQRGEGAPAAVVKLAHRDPV